MTNPQLQPALSQLFRDAQKAHRAAFADTKGENSDWPIWYADYLLEPLEQLTGIQFNKSQLIYCLMNADLEREARAPDSDWADFYAHELIEHFAASDTARKDKLALYYMASCLFCQRVMRVITRLGLDIEMRDVWANRGRRDELIEARGRATVPVLWIESPDGEVRWMPESRDIIHYLESTYG